MDVLRVEPGGKESVLCTPVLRDEASMLDLSRQDNNLNDRNAQSFFNAYTIYRLEGHVSRKDRIMAMDQRPTRNQMFATIAACHGIEKPDDTVQQEVG